MATVTNTIRLPGGIAPTSAAVEIELVASTTAKAAGWVTATDVTILATYRPTVTSGAWTADLTPNADITPSGTVYKVTEYADRHRYIHYIEVGSGGGSVFDLLVDPPASVATAALTSHIADTADAHDASAISVADAGGLFAASNVEAALAEANPPTVADEFSSYSNGVPTSLRKGGAWVMWGGSTGAAAYPTVVGGKLTSNISGSVAAGYAQVQLPANVTKVGGRFTLGAKTTDNGSAVLIAWGSSIASTWPAIPDSPCHLAITSTQAIYGVWSGGSFTQVKAWTFDTPLTCDGATVYTCEVWIDRATSSAVCFLPDGTVRPVSHAGIGAVSGAWACWEYYRQATTDALAAFTEVWATCRSFEGAGMAKWAAALPNPVPKSVVYAPGSSQDKVAPTSLAAVDSTNLKVSVYAPASGKVLIRLSGYLSMSGSTRVFWAVKAGATAFGTTNVVGQQFTGMVTMERLLTGLTPDLLYDFEWHHFALASSTATLKLDSPNGYVATMTATPVP